VHAYEDSTRDRLNEIADELAMIAKGATVPSDKDYAEALAAEVNRLQRNANRDLGVTPAR
jgi:hypothetical protein